MIPAPKTTKQGFWVDQIDTYEKDFSTWKKRSKKIVKRYRDERPDSNNASRMQFNILWSNVQTLAPALYDRPPKPNIDRRFQNDDELGLTVSMVLERSVSYYVGKEMFNEVMTQCVQDRLLPGRGTAWVRYVPQISESPQLTEDVPTESPELYGEDTVVDYVHWEDFGHTPGRTWQEVRAGWRRVFMDRDALIKRFGEEKGAVIPLDAKPLGSKDSNSAGTMASIYEIWDKHKKEVIWLHKDMQDLLETLPDPLGLEEFWPFPKPIFATMTNDSLVPIPDYLQYQDQARELDMLTGRIGKITESLKIAGVYDRSAEGVQRLLSENVENALIPVDNWALFGEKGGLKGVVDYFPVEMVVATLAELYQVRDKVKQDLYEITGISDIIRGASNPNETLGAQELKGKYAGLRLGDMQKDVARFSRDLVRIMAEIIAEHFSLETIKQVSGIRLLTEAEKQQIMMAQQPQMGPDGQPIEPPALPEKVQELLAKPTWEQVEGVLRDNMARCFRIDIETDSTIKVDQDAEKAARTEFLTAAGGFIQQAVQVQNPEMQPILMEMLMFGVRGFKVGRDMETTFQVALDKMRKKAENPQPQGPTPEEIQQKMEAERETMKLSQEAEIEREKIKAESDTKIRVAEIQAASSERQTRISTKAQRNQSESELEYVPELEEPETPTVGELIQTVTMGLNEVLNQVGQAAQAQQVGQQEIVAALNRPKRVLVRRTPDGKMAAAEVV